MFKLVHNIFAHKQNIIKKNIWIENDKIKKLNDSYIKNLESINKRIIELDKYRMNNYPNIPLFKIAIGLSCITFTTIGTYLLFRPQIHNYISSEGAQIAGNIVTSQELKNSLKTILEDKELLDYTQQVLKKIIIDSCNDNEIKQTINQLLIKLLDDQSTQDALVDSAINFINRQEIQDQLSELIIDILNREDVRNKINSIVDETCGDDDNREHVKNMINSIFTSQETKDALYDLGSSLVTTSLFGKKK